MAGTRTRQDRRRARHRRIRKRISGTGERPRMAIMVSNKHMYVQFIDDTANSTLAAVSTLKNGGAGATISKARVLGERAAEVAKAVGIASAIVDRGGFAFHGRVRALVEAASEGGIDVGMKAGEEQQSAPKAAQEAKVETAPEVEAEADTDEAEAEEKIEKDNGE